MDDIKVLYDNNKEAKVGEKITCPVCKTEFVKLRSRQSFCGSRENTKCKDKYWNTIKSSIVKVDNGEKKTKTKNVNNSHPPKKTKPENNLQKPLKKKSSNENWVKEQTPRMIRASAQATLDKLKEQRKGKRFKYIQINPKTVIEVEI